MPKIQWTGLPLQRVSRRRLGHRAKCSGALEGVQYEAENRAKPGKHRIYPLGTTVKLRSRGRTVYLLALAQINAHGNAEASFEDLKTSLPLLWDFIATRGDFGIVAMPVLGSGYSRIPETREVIIREIIQSFIAACAAQRPCESLWIVISFRDFYRHEVNLPELSRFLKHVSRYANFATTQTTGRGEALLEATPPPNRVIEDGRI